ncbi:MAG: tRNA (adenosine(37)-N6)-dimethylallyltransferase MiaA [Pirellulaceae bacterium]|nr:tRNA (adenosine(37)-N6)-dimethylallyltransferase MiaA [Pirellulaceae bacterium]
MSDTDPNPATLPPVRDAWFVTGPTAAGKTQVGLALALRINAEIISLDSMAVYQGMDIGTAKPTRAERERVPHHLLDVVSPDRDYSLSEYVAAAHAAIADIRGRGREVLFVGGTPLYLKSLLRGVYGGPPADWEFREQIERELETLPLAALHQRLEVIDPLLAARLHPHDKRRIIRGLEVFRLTGQRLSHLQVQFDEAQPPGQAQVFVLTWPRDTLHQRLEARVEAMFAAGLVDEVRGLLAKYQSLSRTAQQAVGYREVVEWLGTEAASNTPTRSVSKGGHEPGNRGHEPGVRIQESVAECIERVKARTRQFARRQETWFKSLSECTAVPMVEGESPDETARRILAPH